ncbi:MAG: C25 family peptidase propeptide domain-containing protein [Desulfobacterales bacterium]
MEGTHQKDDVVGRPILPLKTSKIFIPADENVVSTDITCGTLKDIEGSYIIQHVTTPQPTSEKEYITFEQPDSDIYETNALYPSVIYNIRKPQFLNGVKVVLVDLMPVLYNPVEGQLKYYIELEVKITTEKENRPDRVTAYRNSYKDREKILNIIDNTEDFLNFYQASDNETTARFLSASEEPSVAAGTRQYVVITTPELSPAFERLTAYRASSAGGGYTTYIEYIDEISAAYSGVDLA